MLDLGRYLLGVLEILLLLGSAWLGATAARRKLTPKLTGAPAFLATAILAIAGLVWAAELLGAFGLFKALPYLVAVTVVGLILSRLLGGRQGGPSDAAASCFSHRSLSESQ